MKTLFFGTDRVKNSGRMGRIVLAAVVGGVFCVSPVRAASTVAFTETFTGGDSGWNKDGSVSFASAEALISFAQQGGPGGPESATLWCSEGSDGMFQGDYPAKGAEVLGFDFKSDTLAPSALNIFLRGADRTYQRALRPLVEAPGGWITLAVRVDGKASGSWVGPGDEAEFAEAVADVEEISIRAERASAVAATYHVDNVYLYSAPSAAIRTGGGEEGLPQVEWSPLRTNRMYAVMISTDLVSGAWTVDHTFRADEQAPAFDLPDAPSVFMFIQDQEE